MQYNNIVFRQLSDAGWPSHFQLRLFLIYLASCRTPDRHLVFRLISLTINKNTMQYNNIVFRQLSDAGWQSHFGLRPY